MTMNGHRENSQQRITIEIHIIVMNRITHWMLSRGSKHVDECILD